MLRSTTRKEHAAPSRRHSLKIGSHSWRSRTRKPETKFTFSQCQKCWHYIIFKVFHISVFRSPEWALKLAVHRFKKIAGPFSGLSILRDLTNRPLEIRVESVVEFSKFLWSASVA